MVDTYMFVSASAAYLVMNIAFCSLLQNEESNYNKRN